MSAYIPEASFSLEYPIHSRRGDLALAGIAEYLLTIIRVDDYSYPTNGIAYDQELSTSAPDWSLLGLVLAVA